jgi:hypothetical protein
VGSTGIGSFVTSTPEKIFAVSEIPWKPLSLELLGQGAQGEDEYDLYLFQLPFLL